MTDLPPNPPQGIPPTSSAPAQQTPDYPPQGYVAPGYAAPGQPAPGYASPGQPAPGYAVGQPASFPGKGLGIAGLILAILAAPLGLILSIVAKAQSKKAGVKNTPATAGIVVGAILTAVWIIGIIAAIALGASLFGGIAEMCAELGPGVWEVGGITYTCG